MANYDDTATVSGSVVGFSNGADSVPLKNWLVTLPASLDGYTEVNGTKAGKNLIDLSSLVDGYVNSNGTFNTNHPNGEMRSGFIPVKPDTVYYFSIVETTGTAEAWVGVGEYTKNDGTGFVKRDGYWRFTTSSTTKYIVVSARNLAQATKIQLEIGNDPTTWEAYTAPTQYTANLGRTIYGGTPDLVNGTGTENCTNRNLVGEGFTWVLNTTDASFPFFTIGANAPNKASNKNFVCDGYVNRGNYRSNLVDGEIGVFNNTSGINRFCVRDDSCTTLEQFLEKNENTKITYEVTTPTAFTFTPVTIETSKGSNTLWSDQGNTELTYYKDGYGFTSVTVHKETPDGEPVEETRKLHRIIYEGQVDVINGTGLIYRGESGTQYDPPEQISFTPIEVSTDEGENTLYADEGDSAITYRKAVD